MSITDSQERSLKKLEDILNLVQEGLTKTEFVAAFEGVVEFVQKIQATNDSEFTGLKADLKALAKQVKDDATSDVDELRQQVEMVVGAQLATIKAKLDSVKNGKDGRDGEDGLDGKDGKDGERGPKGDRGERGPEGKPGASGNTVRVGWGAHPLQVQALGVVIDKNTRVINFKGTGLSSVTRLPNGVVEVNVQAGGAGSTIYTETPSGTIDGVNTTYTTANTITTVYNLAINGQFLHPTTDYTVAGTTITMVTALPANLSGLPFTITYA